MLAAILAALSFLLWFRRANLKAERNRNKIKQLEGVVDTYETRQQVNDSVRSASDDDIRDRMSDYYR